MNNLKTIMAGYPKINKTKDEIISLAKSEVDMIEIIIPFSDIMTNSPELTKMNNQALKNNISIEDIFNLLSSIKIDKKIIISSYLNPIFRFGYDNFFKKCAQNNVEYINIYDLPQSEIDEIKEYLVKYDIKIFKK